jgi:hypothetical protein
MSTSSENIPNVSFPGGVEPPFKSAPYTLHTSDGKDGDPAVDWTVTLHPDGHRISRTVLCEGKPWELCQQGWDPEEVIWPAWPTRTADDDTPSTAYSSSLSPLADIEDYWSTASNRLRDSAKWMATVLGAALAAVIGTSPLAGIREHRPQGIAIILGVTGLILLGTTLFLVLQVMRPQSVSYTEVQNAKRRRHRLPQSSLYKWQQMVETEQDLYLPAGVTCLTDLRQSMIIEEVTLRALARATATARDHKASLEICDAQIARAARLAELRGAATIIATIGEYYKTRERSTWATYGGVLLGLLGTAAFVAAFAWPAS